MVYLAREHGVKPAARLLACSPRTIRKWLRRYDGTLASLADRSRRPHRSPRRLSPEAEREILAAKKRLPSFGAARLRILFGLPYSEKAIRRVLRDHGLVRTWRRKKHQTKRCLRQIKRHWPAWSQIVMDTKDLSDLPEYRIQARLHRLPRYQYTARDATTGALFLAFADELSLTYSELFVERLLAHLHAHGVDLRRVAVQTDNGSEFVGSWNAKRDSAFTRTVQRFGATHRTIPPRAHRFQADVETVHSLVEYEFYIERFRSRRDFLEKAATYQLFFNTVRPNSGKEHRCPLHLLHGGDLHARFRLLYLPPVFLEDLLRERLRPPPAGHHVWTYP
jgi:transposase